MTESRNNVHAVIRKPWFDFDLIKVMYSVTWLRQSVSLITSTPTDRFLLVTNQRCHHGWSPARLDFRWLHVPVCNVNVVHLALSLRVTFIVTDLMSLRPRDSTVQGEPKTAVDRCLWLSQSVFLLCQILCYVGLILSTCSMAACCAFYAIFLWPVYLSCVWFHLVSCICVSISYLLCPP